MDYSYYPAIDLVATGRKIREYREKRKIKVVDLKKYFNLTSCRVIYRWQNGECLPSLEKMYALSRLFDEPMENIIVEYDRKQKK